MHLLRGGGLTLVGIACLVVAQAQTEKKRSSQRSTTAPTRM